MAGDRRAEWSVRKLAGLMMVSSWGVVLGCGPDGTAVAPAAAGPDDDSGAVMGSASGSEGAGSGGDEDGSGADGSGSGGDEGGAAGGDSGDLEQGIEVGQLAPDFTLPSADGELVSLSDFAGMRIILMGNAEWCAGCQELTEKMQEWYVEQALEDQLIVSVLVQDSTGARTEVDDAARWRDRFGLTFPVLTDPDGDWSAVYGIDGDYGQRSYMVIDSGGVITWVQRDGERARRSDLKEQINAAQ